MSDFSREKIKFSFLVFFAAIFCFVFSVPARAYNPPGVFVTEATVGEIKDNIIAGQFTLRNTENYYLADLNYEIRLLRGTDFDTMKLIDIAVVKDTFFLAPGQKIQKTFSYQYPKNIVSGDYTIRIEALTERGDELGWKDITVALAGESRFLENISSSAKVLAGNNEYFPLEGVTVASAEQVTAVLKIENTGGKMTVAPRVRIFKRMFNMDLVQQYDANPITFEKNETKQIRLDMPKLSAPESYLAEVKFYEGQDQVAGAFYFRWVVKGEGGKILVVKADKDSYLSGETMKITVDSVGPADLTGIGKGNLEIIVYDRDGNIAGQGLTDVDLSPAVNSSVVAIPVAKDLFSPRIEAKLLKGNNVLDKRRIDLPVFSPQAKQLQDKANKANKANRDKTMRYFIYSASAATVIIILVVALFIYIFRRKKITIFEKLWKAGK